ncbi:MAG: hypothetical protein CMJ36_00695 [Phycisphaerae bacterium]|nr:hypothetical protein [Phycisphaerae bacterium]
MSRRTYNPEELASTMPPDMLPTQSVRPLTGPDVSWLLDATRRKDSESPLPPLRLGEDEVDLDLVIKDMVGEGGLGMVSLAMQSCLNRNVAVKQARSDRRNTDAEIQLRKEAELMGQLEHPSIPPIHVLGSDSEGHAVLVMKFVSGDSWGDVLDRDMKLTKNRDAERVHLRKHLEILCRIGEALAFAHGRRIIHRDIKPDNVVVGEYGEVYLIDWGIAAEVGQDGCYKPTGFAGTPAYAAPEMLDRDAMLDERTDVYLLGSTLYQVVTGDAPHPGSSVAEVFDHVVSNPTPDSIQQAPLPLAEICIKSMAEDPADRYQSVREMLEAVRHFMDHGDTAELFARSAETMVALKALVDSQKVDPDQVDTLGQRCRYDLERVHQAWPGNDDVTTMLSDCLLLLCDHAIEQNRIGAARMLLTEHKQIGKGDPADIYRRQDSIEDLVDQMISQNDELSVGIQVSLVEQISALSAEYEDLKKAFDDLRGG